VDKLNTMLARLAVSPYAGDAEFFVSDVDLRSLPRCDIRRLSNAVNHVRETTAYELYRVEGMERTGYLLQLPPANRTKTKHVESIEVERSDDNADSDSVQ